MLSLLQKSLHSDMMMTLKPKFHWTTDGGKFIWIFMSLNLNSSRENSELLTHPCGPCPDCLYQWRWWYWPAQGQSGGQLLNFIFLFEHQPFIIETGGWGGLGGDGGYFGVFTFLYNCTAPGWARDNNSNEIYLKCRHEFFVGLEHTLPHCHITHDGYQIDTGKLQFSRVARILSLTATAISVQLLFTANSNSDHI